MAKNNSKSTLISTVVTIAVLVIVFAFVLPSLGDYSDAFESIQSMQRSDVVLLIGLTMLNMIIYALPYMAAVVGLRFLPAFILRQTSFLFSNAIPGGGAIGFGMQIAMLKSYSFSVAIASSAIVITSAWNLLATIALPGIAALLLLLFGDFNSDMLPTAALGILIAAVSLSIFVVIFKNESLANSIATKIDSLLKKLMKKIGKSSSSVSVKKSILEFRESSYEVTVKRWHLLAASNFAQQCAQFSLLYAALVILDPGSLGIFSALSIFAISRLGSFVPLTPGGVGTIDAIMVSMLVSAGVQSEAALAATLIWRLTTYLPQMAAGVASFLYWRVSSSKKQRPTSAHS